MQFPLFIARYVTTIQFTNITATDIILEALSCIWLVKFLARDVIYTSRAYATMSVSVCLSVTEVNLSHYS